MSTADYDAVSVSVADGVASVRLERPDQRNALSHDLATELIDALESLEGREDVRALVLTGSGGSFCAGGDVNAMVTRLTGDVPLVDAVRRIQRETSRVVRRVHQFPVPTIGKVDGVAFGAGANLALACDCIVASESARFSFGFSQVGLAVDSGTSYLLPRVVGENVAKELVFTGELVDADRAEALGLANRVYPDDEFEDRADEFVDTIAAGPTVALETSKRLISQGLGKSLKAAQEDEAAAQAAVFETGDHREGAEAFMESRDPDFQGE